MGAMAQIASQYIPKEALVVVSVNADSYAKKVDMSEVMALDLFKMLDGQAQQALQDKYDLVSKIYKAPSEAGVNLFPKSYAYVEMIDSVYLVSYVFSLNDASKFEEFLGQTVMPMSSDQKVMKGKGYSYLTTTAQGAMGICWTSNTASIMTVNGESKGMYEGMNFDDPDYYEKLEARKQAMAASQMEVLMSKASRITGIKKETVGTSPNFILFENSTYDIGAWMNMGAFSDLMMKQAQGEMPPSSAMQMGGMLDNLQGMYKNSYYHALLNFDAGALDLKVRTYMPADMMGKYGKIYDKKINPDFFKYIKKEGLLGLGMVAVDMKEAISVALDTYMPIIEAMPEVGGKAQPTLDLLGIALDEEALANIIKGDMMVGITDVREVETTYIDYEYDEDYNMNKVEKTRKDVQPIVTALATIGNKDNFMKIIKALEGFGVIKKEGMTYKLTIPNAGFSPTIAVQGDLLVVSNDEGLFASMAKGFSKGSQVDAVLQLEALKHNQFFYADITNIINKVIAISTPPEKEKKMMMLVNDYMKNAHLSGIDNKGAYFQYDFAVNMEDEKMNSAIQIFQMANKAFLMQTSGE